MIGIDHQDGVPLWKKEPTLDKLIRLARVYAEGPPSPSAVRANAEQNWSMASCAEGYAEAIKDVMKGAYW